MTHILKEEEYKNAVIWFGTSSQRYGIKPSTGFDLSKIRGCKLSSSSFQDSDLDVFGDYFESNLDDLARYFEKLICERKNIHYFNDGTIASVLFPKAKSPSDFEMMFIKREALLQGIIVTSRSSEYKEHWLSDEKHREWS